MSVYCILVWTKLGSSTDAISPPPSVPICRVLAHCPSRGTSSVSGRGHVSTVSGAKWESPRPSDSYRRTTVGVLTRLGGVLRSWSHSTPVLCNGNFNVVSFCSYSKQPFLKEGVMSTRLGGSPLIRFAFFPVSFYFRTKRRDFYGIYMCCH